MRHGYRVKPRLGTLLKQHHLTQIQLQEMTGVPQATISRFDSNKRHENAHLVAISRALKISIEDLFEIQERRV